jgi:hypothetical protein
MNWLVVVREGAIFRAVDSLGGNPLSLERGYSWISLVPGTGGTKNCIS